MSFQNSVLQQKLDEFIKKWESKEENLFFSYQIVSFKLGIQKDFYLRTH